MGPSLSVKFLQICQVQSDSPCKRDKKISLPTQNEMRDEDIDYYLISLSIRIMNDNEYVKNGILAYLVLPPKKKNVLLVHKHTCQDNTFIKYTN